MTKYTYVPNKSWQRCYEIKVNNPATTGRKITFYEELAVEVDGNLIVNPLTSCATPIEKNNTIPVVDTNTNQPTGETITQEKLIQYLHSFYIQTATNRDAQTLGMFNTAPNE